MCLYERLKNKVIRFYFMINSIESTFFFSKKSNFIESFVQFKTADVVLYTRHSNRFQRRHCRMQLNKLNKEKTIVYWNYFKILTLLERMKLQKSILAKRENDPPFLRYKFYTIEESNTKYKLL